MMSCVFAEQFEFCVRALTQKCQSGGGGVICNDSQVRDLMTPLPRHLTSQGMYLLMN